jgi:hypothetical protein
MKSSLILNDCCCIIIPSELVVMIYSYLIFKKHGYFSAEKFLVLAPTRPQVSPEKDSLAQKNTSSAFAPWSLFPFIVRDVAVWVPEDVKSDQIHKIIKSEYPEIKSISSYFNLKSPLKLIKQASFDFIKMHTSFADREKTKKVYL